MPDGAVYWYGNEKEALSGTSTTTPTSSYSFAHTIPKQANYLDLTESPNSNSCIGAVTDEQTVFTDYDRLKVKTENNIFDAAITSAYSS